MFEQFYQLAERALHSYLRRGQLALQAILEENFDEASDILAKRKASFYNFRNADQLILKNGWDITQEKKFQKLWQEICEVDKNLVELIERYKLETRQEMITAQRARSGISKYRSRLKSAPGFNYVV